MRSLHPSGTCMRSSGWSRVLMPPLPSKEDQMLGFRRPQHQRYGPERGGGYPNHLGISGPVGSAKGEKGQKDSPDPLPISVGTPTQDFQESGCPGQKQKIQFEVFRSPSPNAISIFEGKEWLGADREQSGPSWVENPL
jgi:hypothetical protein